MAVVAVYCFPPEKTRRQLKSYCWLKGIKMLWRRLFFLLLLYVSMLSIQSQVFADLNLTNPIEQNKNEEKIEQDKNEEKIEKDPLGTISVDDIGDESVVTTPLTCSSPDDKNECRVILIYSDETECKTSEDDSDQVQSIT